jgi:hypothetical protein
MIRPLLGLSLILVISAGTARAGRFPRLEVEAPPELQQLAEEIGVLGKGDFSGALALTGRPGFGETITVVLAPEGGSIAERTPSWVSGFAEAGSRTIVLFPGRVARYPDDDLETLLHHELAHILVAEAAAGRPVPRWFNEGVATVAAREWGIEDRARYSLAVIGRGPSTAAELDAAFAQGGRRVARAYALSSAFIRSLRSEYGAQVTARILELLAGGRGFREAFVRATGDTLEVAEHRFFVRQALWHTWIPLLSSSGLLWAGITMLALMAFRRRSQRSREMRERWQAEEAAIERLVLDSRPPVSPVIEDPGLDGDDEETVN